MCDNRPRTRVQPCDKAQIEKAHRRLGDAAGLREQARALAGKTWAEIKEHIGLRLESEATQPVSDTRLSLISVFARGPS